MFIRLATDLTTFSPKYFFLFSSQAAATEFRLSNEVARFWRQKMRGKKVSLSFLRRRRRRHRHRERRERRRR